MNRKDLKFLMEYARSLRDERKKTREELIKFSNELDDHYKMGADNLYIIRLNNIINSIK